MKLKYFATLFFAGLLAVIAPGGYSAFDPVDDDTDLFLANPNIPSSRANVLIILDNTANWNTPFDAEKAALVSVVNNLSDGFNLGLMMLVETGGGNDSVDGGYVRAAIRQMTGTNKTTLSTLVNGLDKLTDKGNNATYALAMHEAYLYFAGKTSLSGIGKVKRDVTAFTSSTSSTYASPIVDACQKNVIIFISNGPVGSSEDGPAETLLAALQGTAVSQISLTPSGEQSCVADEYSKFIGNNDVYADVVGVPKTIGIQKIRTYALEINPGSSGQGPSHTAMMRSMAKTGKYLAATDEASIKAALNSIFSEVQAENSVFASVSLPVSVNVRGTNLNQVYIGVFRPDANKLPRWFGNLKLYQLAVQNDVLFLADAAKIAAENPNTGLTAPGARSFWTQTSTFWDTSFRSEEQNGVGGISDLADGDIVEKGGVAQRLRLQFPTASTGSTDPTAATSRKLYTCLASCVTANTATSTPTAIALTATAQQFESSNAGITDALLGLSPPQTLTSLVRGTPGATTATATATVTGHGFSNGQAITIAGANLTGTQGAYAGTFNISNVAANTFDYTVQVTPASPATGTITATTPANPKTMTSLVRSGTTATATFGAAHGFINGATITISGANQSAYNGNFVITCTTAPACVGSTSFTYAVTETPTASTTGTMKAQVGTGTLFSLNSPLTRSASGVVSAATTVNSSYSVGNLVTITGAADAAYNGTFSVASVGPGQRAFTYNITVSPATPATGTITADIPPAAIAVTALSRSNTTATVTTDLLVPALTGTSIIIAGAEQSQYNGTFAIVSGSGTRTITYAVPVSPITPATGTITAAADTSDATTRDLLIKWVRGQDNVGPASENNDSVLTDIRSSIHGDVLHSRPAIVNYNRFGDNNDVFIFYGTNDGVFRAIKGGIPSCTAAQVTAGTCPPLGSPPSPNFGDEVWGFVPTEFFGKLKRLRGNSTGISSTNKKPYFADGPVSVFTENQTPSDNKLTSGAGDKVHLYIGMRRGGRFIYALDASDPLAPKFLWKIDNNTAGFSELGQTWSEPKVARINATSDPVLIFGAGYDPAVEDINPCLVNSSSATAVNRKTGGTVTYTATGSCTTSGTTNTDVARSMGRGIFVVNAITGKLIFQAKRSTGATSCSGTAPVICSIAGMDFSIAADLTVFKSRTGTFVSGSNPLAPLADRVYAADTGGNVWRVDISNASPSSWEVTKLASIADQSTAAGRRKFLFPPDVVFTGSGASAVDTVLLGSGDREHPFDATVTNRFYMFKDTQTGLTSSGPTAITEADLFDATADCIQNSAACTNSVTDGTVGQTGSAAAATLLAAARGWFITLGVGEKNVGTAVTLGGTTFFNTNQPSASSSLTCGNNLGIARQYLVSYLDATATKAVVAGVTLTAGDRSTVFEGGGFLPSPVPVVVEIDGKKYEAVCTGAHCEKTRGATLGARIKTYWRRNVE